MESVKPYLAYPEDRRRKAEELHVYLKLNKKKKKKKIRYISVAIEFAKIQIVTGVADIHMQGAVSQFSV